jgi:hypothetical protein
MQPAIDPVTGDNVYAKPRVTVARRITRRAACSRPIQHHERDLAVACRQPAAFREMGTPRGQFAPQWNRQSFS